MKNIQEKRNFSSCKACIHNVVWGYDNFLHARQFVELDVEWRYRELCGFSRDHLELSRDHYHVIALLAIQSVVRIITCPIITRYAIRHRSITRVSPLIGISQDRKLVRVRKKRKKALATARERAWVLARYDTIMRYARTLSKGGGAGMAEGNRAGEKKRDRENGTREQEEKKPDEVTEKKEEERDGWSCHTDLD